MKLLSPIDVTVLTWLKPELDSTLNQARSSLEHYVEEGQGVTSLRECVTHLHQVAGILNMVELAGAARLSEEMEQLAYGLAEGDVKASENAFSFLMQCIVQLPDYLERLQNGHRDVPAVLLPLINELRSIRGEVPLGEESVYSAATHLPIPAHAFDSSRATNGGIVFSDLALQFQAYLLAWINNQGDKQATHSLAESCAQIGAQIQDESSRKVFWVASALLDAASNNKLISSKAIRNSIIKIDQEVNYINNRILGEVRQSSPVRLTQELLYFVAQNRYASDRLQQVYDVFELERNIPNESEIEHAKSSLLGRNNALLQSVSAVIKEDILRVKDSLDMFIRNQDAAPKDFVELVSVLNRIENTLGLIDAKEAKDLINLNKDTIQGYINGLNPLGEPELMSIAKSLLSVELMLDSQGVDSATNSQTKLASDFLSSSQSNQLLDALIRESIVNFAAARQAFVAFVESYWDHTQLAVIPSLFKQVSGALAILEFTPVSNFIDAINSYTRYEFIEQKKVPSAATMERLAEVLASLEYYLESVRDRRPNREKILDITQKSLEALNYWPVPAYAIQAPGTFEEYKVQAPVVQAPVANVPVPAAEVTEIVNMPFAGSDLEIAEFKPDTNSIGIIQTHNESDAELLGFDINAEGIDDEIREIFLEEFAEESANLTEFYACWQADLENIEHVRPIRRVFHTFKGSGRLVGAKDLSDFSWKIESLLNRVLDGSRPPSNEVISMLGIAINVLPKFNSAMLGEKVFLDLEGLSNIVDRLAAGEEAIYKPSSKLSNEVKKSVETIVSEPQSETVANVHSSIDPVLLEILKPEVSGHVETINAWLDSVRNSSHPIFEDTVFRAIHTMNGAFAMSEVQTMSELLAPTETLLRRAIANKTEVKSETIYFIGQVVAAVKQTLQDLTENKSPASFQELASRAAALRDELPELSAISSVISLDAEDLEAERVEAERAEAERAEAERAEAERVEAERVEAERAEAERVEAERVEAERVDALPAQTQHINERLDTKRIGGKRGEAMRLEAKRLEAKRLEALRLEALRLEEEINREIQPTIVEQTHVDIMSNEQTIAEVKMINDQETSMANLDMSDLDEELLDIFAEEAKDLLDQSDNLLVNLKAESDNFDHLHGLQRHLHTIKGGARMAGLYTIGELSHSLETVLHHNTENRIVPNAKQISIIERSLDALHKMANLVEERKSPELPQDIMQLLESSQHAEVPDDYDQITAAAKPEHTETVGFKPLSGPIALPDLDADEAIRTPQEVVRIRADLLEQLVNFSGEVAIYRARLEQQLGLFKINLVELDQTTTRLREQLRRLDIETEAQIAARNIREVDQGRQDFDPLELDRFTNQQQLSRSLAETSNDLVNLQATMDDLTRHHETLLLQQSRVSSELQEGLMRTRMLPFETLLPRLRRVLRQASQDAGKDVQLRVEGAQGEMDRTVLDRMIAPLEHLLRNAVAHGIEEPNERKKAGKLETATVVINIAHEGTEVVLSVRDDGRGMNVKQIHAKGVERGLVSADAEMTEKQVLSLITQTGFTTADTVTRLSGRGVGMDVVNNEIKSLNGTLSIQTSLNKGTEFIVRLPLNLAVTKAVFVKIGESMYAIPIASVDGVGRIGREELQEKNKNESPEFNYAGNTHKIYDLGTLLEMPKAQATGSMQMPMLLSKSGQDRIAVCVDQVLGSQEIVVKPVGPQVTSIPGVYGASIMPDGGVIVILDLAPLVRHNANRTEQQEVEVIDTTKRSMPLVMVVDDSITMRKVTSRILERNSYEVITARDGLEAIEKMAEQVPDLVLLDIEMPRMDGYEVAQNMKADSRLMNVPIMMITSRTGDKHRQRAFDLGVERYLGKPYQELELMRQVNDVFKK